MATASYSSNSIDIWDPEDGTLIRTLSDHADFIHHLAVLDNGHLASSSDDNEVKIWNLPGDNGSSSVIQTITTPFPCIFLTSLPNAHLACSYSTNGLGILDANEGTVLETIAFSGEIRGMAVINNGQHIAGCIANENRILIWDANDLALVKTIEPADCFAYLTTLRDGNLVVGGNDARIRIHYIGID